MSLVRVVAVVVRVVARASVRSKTVDFKGRLAKSRHFCTLVRVRALADQNGSFLKAGLVQNRQFWLLARARASGRSSRRVAVSLGSVTRAWSGRRRVIGIADQGVVWAVSLGLLTRASSG